MLALAQAEGIRLANKLKRFLILDVKILVIEDEVRSAKWLKVYLEQAGYKVELAFDGPSGLNAARTVSPDLIILDLMLPGISGSEICRLMRNESDIPVIMLTAKGSREDRVEGFSDGADDYIVKPFDVDEVIARVKAVLRRSVKTTDYPANCGRLSLDYKTERVFIDGVEVQVSHTQFLILSAFMRNQDAVLSRQQLIELSFDRDFDAYERSIDTHIKRLRKRIHREGFEPIQTVYGGGYRLKCEST